MYLFLFFSIVAGLRKYRVAKNADSQQVIQNACLPRHVGILGKYLIIRYMCITLKTENNYISLL